MTSRRRRLLLIAFALSLLVGGITAPVAVAQAPQAPGQPAAEGGWDFEEE